jgi:hypothetical protein
MGLPADFFADEVAGGREADPPRYGAGGVMVGMDVRHDSADTVLPEPIDHELSGVLGVATALIRRADHSCDVGAGQPVLVRHGGLNKADWLGVVAAARDPVQPALGPVL